MQLDIRLVPYGTVSKGNGVHLEDTPTSFSHKEGSNKHRGPGVFALEIECVSSRSLAAPGHRAWTHFRPPPSKAPKRERPQTEPSQFFTLHQRPRNMNTTQLHGSESTTHTFQRETITTIMGYICYHLNSPVAMGESTSLPARFGACWQDPDVAARNTSSNESLFWTIKSPLVHQDTSWSFLCCSSVGVPIRSPDWKPSFKLFRDSGGSISVPVTITELTRGYGREHILASEVTQSSTMARPVSRLTIMARHKRL
ncbi:hypothetical protein H920_01795 [Fukomys damarensis]|uniref:Uncharacterized protein n=1 Tax=Fukomys damarensis TaxID=885580 RepID=A0A091E0F2_FUKDA|nr:hypothetical protein H920_01795 [Fukomys damarensis]